MVILQPKSWSSQVHWKAHWFKLCGEEGMAVLFLFFNSPSASFGFVSRLALGTLHCGNIKVISLWWYIKAIVGRSQKNTTAVSTSQTSSCSPTPGKRDISLLSELQLLATGYFSHSWSVITLHFHLKQEQCFLLLYKCRCFFKNKTKTQCLKIQLQISLFSLIYFYLSFDMEN